MKILQLFVLFILALSNLCAIENIKVSGDTKLYYGSETANAKDTTRIDLFDKDASYVDFGLHLNLSADLSKNISAGVSLTAVSTLGLENNIGSIPGIWSGAHDISSGDVDDAAWIDELWFSYKLANTTTKLGRQSLDTPLVATETWGTSANTFEAVIVVNEDIDDTVLTAMYIGNSNGVGDDSSVPSNKFAINSVNGKFHTFANNGAYVFGLVNNSYKPLNLKLWYYEMDKFASAYWLQADFDLDGLLLGAQYTNIESDAIGAKDDTAYGLMLGYNFSDIFTIKTAYSSVDDEGTLGVANIATRDTNSGSMSALYTEMWWWYGTVSLTGADSISLSVEGTVGDDYELFLAYWLSDIDPAGVNNNDEVVEYAFSITKSFGPLDTTTAFIYDSFKQELGFNTGDIKNITTFLVFLQYNF